MLLESINDPADLRALGPAELAELATEIRPPLAVTMRCTIDSPSPVPPARRVKNGWKMRSRSPGGMPGPPSRTRIATWPPAARPAASSTQPPFSCTWMALSTRFESAR